jgi:hypothetical protein
MTDETLYERAAIDPVLTEALNHFRPGWRSRKRSGVRRPARRLPANRPASERTISEVREAAELRERQGPLYDMIATHLVEGVAAEEASTIAILNRAGVIPGRAGFVVLSDELRARLDPVSLPAEIHQRLAEAIGGQKTLLLPAGIHRRLAEAIAGDAEAPAGSDLHAPLARAVTR